MDTAYIKNLLRRYGLKPNFTYGQNFLADDIVLQDIVDAAEITSADNILEIGPGLGTLTEKLCERAGFVLSIEKDPKFLPVLKAMKKNYKNFRYEIADALQYDFQKFFSDKGVGYLVVANIPYYITGKILQMLLTAKNKPTSIVILTQKEVAQSLSALAGNMSVLAISVQLFGKPDIVQIVPARSFFPPPKVDSAVVRIVPYAKPRYKIDDEKKFFKIVKACFAGKRKQIHNTLRNNLKLSQEQVDEILSAAKINPSVRPQELGIEQWKELVDAI